MTTATPGAILGQYLFSERFRKPPHVFSATQADATVLLDAERGLYFTLNEVGGRAWELLVAGEPLIEVFQCLGNEFEIEAETLQGDIVALIDQLLDRKLIERVPG